MVHLFVLRLIHSFQFCGGGFQSTVGPASDSSDHLQIPEHLLDGTVSRWGRSLALSFQEQLRLFENALPDLG